MSYSETVNLPDTNFAMKAGLSEQEPERLRTWQESNLYEQILEDREDREQFVLHDGPPYANGDIHLGHALNKILKDILVKFKSMRGFQAPYRPGWDCHGLPIEHEVLSARPETAQEGRMAIREACREYALEHVEVQKEQFKKLGVMGSWEDPYLTLDPSYEADILRTFRDLVEEGFIYRQLKPIHWCWECETALAEAEVEHDTLTSPAVYVDFPVVEDPNDVLRSPETRVMIWTTTPWTLPANSAIAAHPDLNYVEFRDPGGKTHLVAERLLAATISRMDWSTNDVEILAEHGGEELAGLICSHPLIEDRESPVINGELVTTDQGTGFVHIAPGHGQEDYELGEQYDLEIRCPVNNQGTFTAEYPPQEGVHVLTANDWIVEELDRLGALFHTESVDHSYPFCWRCKKPVLFRATPQWFMDVDHQDLRQRVLDRLEEIDWLPERGEERFRAMMEDRPDWCLSRQRAWGVPIPAVECSSCGEARLDSRIMENLIKQVEQEGVNVWFEEPIESVLPEGLSCEECGSGDFVKQDDILDVWFDSGSSHRAVLQRDPDLRFPADVYLEGSDQHRGWFQLSMLPSMALEDEPPFRELITHGFVMDEKGKKMSKSQGNVTSPLDVIEEDGADILRLWVASENYQEDLVIGEQILEQVRDKYRRIRNTCKFFLGNLQEFEGFDPEVDAVDVDDLHAMDRWFLAELYGVTHRVSRAYQDRDFHRAFNQINNFCAKEASSLYLDISKDRLYCAAPDSSERRSAQTVLNHALRTLTRLIAPVLCFTADEIWDYLPEETSVHRADWPDPPRRWMDESVVDDFDRLRDIRGEVTGAIEQSEEVSDSERAHVSLGWPGRESLLERYRSMLEDWFLVSEVSLLEDVEETTVRVRETGHDKCERCWRHRPDVHPRDDRGGDPLCDRCVRVLDTSADAVGTPS